MKLQQKKSTKKPYHSPQLFVYGNIDEITAASVDTPRNGDGSSDSLPGGIAQNLNKLLMVILANISLAQRRAKPGDKISEALKNAEKVCLRAKELTRGLTRYHTSGTK